MAMFTFPSDQRGLAADEGVSTPLLSIQGISIRVPSGNSSYRAVEDVSFDIGRGQSVALVGESGSGKSLTVQAILGLLPRGVQLESGRIEFDGAEIVRAGARPARGYRGLKIGTVFQDPLSSLNPTMRIGEQVAEVFRVHRGTPKRAAALAARESLAEAGIPEPRAAAECYPHELSGGQRQRVMIAMALALRPPLLIADEPTTALDLTIQAQIVDLILNLRKEHGLAVLLVTHDLALVAELTSKVVVLYAGHVMEQGPLREIYEDSHNPYTRALLRSTAPDTTDIQSLAPIPGSPPSLAERVSGCAFSPRCYMASDLCARSRPVLEPIGAGQSSALAGWESACHYRDEVTEPGR
jgi:oligopeptide transport system ATP-binding protein